MPKVSVIIPTYNRAELLREAIDSVLAQTYKDFELIVVDDNSTDNTKDVVEGDTKNFQNIRYTVNRHKKGASGSRNTGIELASGEWIAFLDSDDLWREDKLQLQMSLAEKDDNIGFIFTNFSCFPEENKEHFIFARYEDKKYKTLFSEKYWAITDNSFYIQKKPIFPVVLKTLLQIKTPSIIVKRSLLSDIRYDEELVINEDIALALRVNLKCIFGYIDLPLVKIRRHNENVDLTVPEEEKTRSALRFCDNLAALLKSGQVLSREGRESIKFAISRFYFDIGYSYRLKGDFDNAKMYYLKAIRRCFNPKYLIGLIKLVTLKLVTR